MTVPAPASSASVADATLAGEATSRKRGGLRRRDRIIGLFAVAPAFLVVVGFMAFPVIFALYISFTKTNGLTFEWRGLDNYFALVSDPVVHQVFLNNLKFLISVPLVIFVALIVSVLLFEQIRGWRFFRVIFFLPNVLSVAVIGIMFRNAFGYYGAVNQAIGIFGGEPVQFFTDGTLAIGIIILALVWSGFGYQSLLLLAGLTAINPAVFEAAAIDGAGWWKRLWYITLPNIRRVLGFVFIINVLYTFTALFGFIFVMTAGGPGFETTTIDYLVYLRAFSSSNLGSGAALGGRALPLHRNPHRHPEPCIPVWGTTTDVRHHQLAARSPLGALAHLHRAEPGRRDDHLSAVLRDHDLAAAELRLPARPVRAARHLDVRQLHDPRELVRSRLGRSSTACSSRRWRSSSFCFSHRSRDTRSRSSRCPG